MGASVGDESGGHNYSGGVSSLAVLAAKSAAAPPANSEEGHCPNKVGLPSDPRAACMYRRASQSAVHFGADWLTALE